MDKKKLILIIDDNPENIKVLGSLLTSKDYEVGASADGLRGLEFVNNVKPDLILLDVMMPGMNGFDVCIKLKENSESKNIPIIFLTAKTSEEDIVKGFNLGGADYVTKPFNSAELLSRVNTHLVLQNTINELELALSKVKTLSGLIPICSHCKKVRDDSGYWQQVEEYISVHSEAQFSHSLCNDCVKEIYPEMADKILKKKK